MQILLKTSYMDLIPYTRYTSYSLFPNITLIFSSRIPFQLPLYRLKSFPLLSHFFLVEVRRLELLTSSLQS